ncbi:GntR family transcriptional regulator [Brevibacterium litoralis]|uniref:GntR family transcriptional regulator n=1 Tax=Brevibacterium litoralis TaxID=3138935 RepID=UPI0032EBDDCD
MSLAEYAYVRLRERLVMLEIEPGEPINDVRAAADLDMGRTPVREALKRLELDHLVQSFPRRGTFATHIDVTQLGSISEIRQQLVPFAAEQAALRATPDARAELRDLVEALATQARSDRRPADLMRQDIAVHQAIYRAAGNPHLEDVLVRYDNLATRIWCLVIDRLPDLGAHVREHMELLDAAVEGDAARARALATAHVEGFAQEIRRVL